MESEGVGVEGKGWWSGERGGCSGGEGVVNWRLRDDGVEIF